MKIQILAIYIKGSCKKFVGIMKSCHSLNFTSDFSQFLTDMMVVVVVGVSLNRCTLEPGDKILDCPPTFTMYAFDAAVNGASVVKGASHL
jgi:hypothetical protein